MQHHIAMGSSPALEPCAPRGAPGYEELARRECNAFKAQLFRMVVRKFGVISPDTSFRLRVKEQQHDFGTYLEVVACFDFKDERASGMAQWLNDHVPGEWDAPARADLSL